MTSRQQLLVMAFHAAIAVVVLICVTVLTALHDLSPEAAIATIAAALGFAGATGGQLALMGQTVNGKNVISNEGVQRIAQGKSDT